MRRVHTVRMFAAFLFGLSAVIGMLIFAPQVRAATVTGALAQSQVVSITGGYNTTTQVYEQTGTAVTATQFNFTDLTQVKSSACSQVSSIAVVCAAYAGGGPPGAYEGNVYFYLSNDGNNPVITAEDNGQINWGPIFLGTCAPSYTIGMCSSGTYASANLMSPSSSVTVEFQNQEASSYPNDVFWAQLGSALGLPLVEVEPVSETVAPVYSWVTTTVWHPVQISYS